MTTDYKATLNLPVTKFPMKADLTRREPEIRKRWDAEDLYAQIRRARKGKEKYIVHDGPPYPTGDLHIGTGLNKILKDLIVRYKTMRGYDAPFIPGWDCHGLPIEHRVMQSLTKGKDPQKLDELLEEARDESKNTGQLRAKTRKMLSSLLIPEEKAEAPEGRANKPTIRKLCRHYAELYVNLQKAQFKALGVSGDWDNPYLTLNHQYEAAVIDTFGKLVEGGYVYRSLKPIHWCTHCETALAEAELEYDEKTSPSIFVNFKLADDVTDLFKGIGPERDVHILIWTTTPWTIPANLAIAVHPESHYAAVRYTNPITQKKEVSIMAQSLVESVMEKLGINNSFEILGSALGRDLKERKYRHPLRYPPGLGATASSMVIQLDALNLWMHGRIVTADYVSLKEGTGCVHTAPGHGQEDYQTGLKYKLPIFSPVDSQGRFTHEAGDFIAGHGVYEANPKIVERLETVGALVHKTSLKHSYPHCWRCKQPVIFRATKQWFISLDHNDLRGRALEAIKNTQWVPAWGMDRIGGMIHQRPDWCISRQRSWGVPIPAFHCEDCEEILLTSETIYHVRDVFREKGSDSWFILDAKDFLPPDASCKKCGGKRLWKEMDIFDVWFESGSSHHAVLHGNKDLSFPADVYLEGTDQHRGWFQLSLLPSVGAWGSAPFRMVLTHGFVVDEKGEKMSKSLGNFISVEDALGRFGADIIRLWTSSQDYRQDINTSVALMGRMSDVYRRIRNTFRYLLGNLYDFDPCADNVDYGELPEIDRWALSRTQGLIQSVTRAFEDLEFHKVHHSIHNFCAVDMSAFYLDILKDRLYTAGKKSKERRAAQTVLHNILHTLVKISAPLLVHTAEEVWSFIEEEHKDEPLSSVHLTTWPEAREEWVDRELEQRWHELIGVRDFAYCALETIRKGKIIGQSLEAKVTLYIEDKRLYNLLNERQDGLPSLFIVSEVALMNEPYKNQSHKNVLHSEMLGAGGNIRYTVGVDKSENPKCGRCWNYFASVGKNSNHPTLCSRCVAVIEAI
ncbi:MAG: isoleucine--tRNA ligase [Candidatus Brocadiales bacterium]